MIPIFPFFIQFLGATFAGRFLISGINKFYKYIIMEQLIKFDDLPSEFFLMKETLSRILSILDRPSVASTPNQFNFDGLLNYFNSIGLSMSKSKQQKLTASGKIPFSKFNNRLVFDKSEIDEWIRANTTKESEKSNATLNLALTANRANRKLNKKLA